MIVNIVCLVVGFVVGILVGRRNQSKVETAVGTVKTGAKQVVDKVKKK